LTDPISINDDFVKIGKKIFCNYCSNGYHNDCLGITEDQECECECE